MHAPADESTEGWLSVGSDPSCDVVIADAGLGARHATLRAVGGGGIEIRDGGSFHGTFVDGVRVDAGVATPGARVDLAGATFRVQDGRLVGVRHARRGARLDLYHASRRADDGTILFEGIDATVLPGELVAVIGASGAGKTSLVRTIVGAEPPDEGIVLVDGEDRYLHHAPLGTAVGYLPQQPFLHGRLTVRAAVTHSARLRGIPDESVEDVVQRALERAHIGHRADARVDRLSGGESKRAHLAAELVGEPGILVLDEPTSGLDALLDLELMALFRELADEGTALVVVTHALDHLDACDRLLVLGRGGVLVSDATPERTRAWFAAGDLTECLRVVEHDVAAARARHDGRRLRVPAPARSRRYRTPDVASAPNPVRQVLLLARRGWELLARDRRTLVSLLLQAPVIGIALAAVTQVGSFADVEVPATVTAIVVFGLVITAVWLATLAAARELTKEATVFARERLLGVRPSSYLASKALILVPIAAWQAAVILGIVCVVAGLPPAGVLTHAVPEAFVSLLLAVFVAIGLGLLVSALAPNEDRAIALVPYVLLPQFLLAGIAFKVPAVLEPVQFATVAYWGIGAVGSTVDVCGHPFGGAASCAATLGISFGRADADLLLRWGVLAAMGMLTWTLAWLLLARSDPARRYR